MYSLKSLFFCLGLFGAVQSYAQQPQRTGGNGNGPQKTGVNIPDYEVGEGCDPVSEADITRYEAEIEAEIYPEEKVDIAKLISRRSCMSAEQAGRILDLYESDDDRYTVAEYLYRACSDPVNFYSEVKGTFYSDEYLNKIKTLTSH